MAYTRFVLERGLAGDALDLSSRDTVMPVVPMYHANAWSLIFAGPDWSDFRI